MVKPKKFIDDWEEGRILSEDKYYSEEGITELLDNDEITAEEAWFLMGYMGG